MSTEHTGRDSEAAMSRRKKARPRAAPKSVGEHFLQCLLQPSRTLQLLKVEETGEVTEDFKRRLLSFQRKWVDEVVADLKAKHTVVLLKG